MMKWVIKRVERGRRVRGGRGRPEEGLVGG
jgi:hypothetical protein